LEIKFLRPIALNGAICATAWLEETERRKARVRCKVTDGEGNELAECASTWIALKPKV
jgi:acyl-CoA thioesterase FadM